MTSGNRELASRIVFALRGRGFQAYFVGGCVRDLLLRLEPEDYDVATDATPEQILEIFPKAELVGAHFGVVLVKEGERAVEVATFRSEGAYSDGRRPGEVTLVREPREDARRRDFTINAMFLDPVSNQVLDFFSGLDDLDRGLLRAVGEPAARFAEDHLRMLRAVRFAARFGFTIEPTTFEAIRTAAPAIRRISAERIRAELNRILTEGGASRGLRLLDETGLLAEVLPEVKALQGVEQPPEFHPEGDVWTHTLLLLDRLQEPTVTLAWGALLHDIGKPAAFERLDRIRFNGHVDAGVRIARRMLARLKFSLDEQERILALIENHMRFADVRRMKESTLKRFLRLPHFEEHLELHRADCLASHGHLDNWEYARERFANAPAEALRPPRLLTGRDLMAMGYGQGPRLREILEAVETAQLEGEIGQAEEARAFVRERFPL